MSIYIPTPDELETQYESHIIVLLRQLGIADSLFGAHYLTVAIAHAAANPSKIFFVTKELYPYVARKFNTSANRVERDIRTAILIGWKSGMDSFLEHISEVHLTRRPTSSFFIQLLANYIRHQF